MGKQIKSLTVQVGGISYQIKSDVDEEYMKMLVSYINQKIAAFKNEGKVIPAYNLIVLAAISIADDYFSLKKNINNFKDISLNKIDDLENRIGSIIKNLDESLLEMDNETDE